MGLTEATASFKRGSLDAREYYDTFLEEEFGGKLPEMLPKLLEALPPEQAAALADITKVILSRTIHQTLILVATVLTSPPGYETASASITQKMKQCTQYVESTRPNISCNATLF